MKSLINKLKFLIGKKVIKARNKTTNIKPFKSRLMYNTIKDIVINTNTNNLAFSFYEDDSVVDIRICKIEDQILDVKLLNILDDHEINLMSNDLPELIDCNGAYSHAGNYHEEKS